ncbi:TetR family transcriptional regulator C-terminal domain-containing protein [Paenarthrobacter sp. CCNWLY172]|uniref:TetR family transcriptional regulator C-terminal domain-containing protein n=1 Tax=unclassified Paenarthrobacter TaxID=2634190 RepID=UPI003079DF48
MPCRAPGESLLQSGDWKWAPPNIGKGSTPSWSRSFGSHAEIIAAAVRASSGRFLEKLAESVDPDMSPTARLAAVMSAGTTAGLDDDVSRILYEYWPHMLRDPEQRRIQDELTSAQEQIYRDIIDAGTRSGEFSPLLDPAKIARTLVAQEDGLVMDVLAGSAGSEYVLDLMGSLASALLGLPAGALLERMGARSAPAT